METIPSLLEAALRPVVAALGGEEPRVTAATDPRFGDYQTNVAMVLAKAQRTNPRQLATKLIADLDVSGISDRPEIAGAGFINFRIRPEYLAQRFAALLPDERLGVDPAEPARRIILDFSGPNIAKPMHVGHIRSTILGDALSRIARFLGHEVISDNHLGDWGTQFGKVIYGWKHFLDRAALEREPVEELVRLYKKANALCDEDPSVMEACRGELARLQQGDPENTGIWRRSIELSRGEFDAIYGALGVQFDEWLGESSYNDRLEPLVQRYLREGVAELSEGATCVFFREDDALADKPCLIRKSDGAFLYATTDLATIEYRVERWNPDAIWYVTGAPQQLHFQQVFASARKAGIQSVELRHIPFGSILGEDRKLMKTRSGDNVSLRDLLDEARERALKLVEEKNPDLPSDEKTEIASRIGIGAVKYADLSQFRMTDYVFAWDRMLSLQGNTAPYLQNAYVRVQSIFRKLDAPFEKPETVAFSEPAEVTLAKKLIQFSEVVPTVLDDCRPNVLATYLYELANTFHTFYEACPVLKSDGAVRASRLSLCEQTARTLWKGLELLGINVPERM